VHSPDDTAGGGGPAGPPYVLVLSRLAASKRIDLVIRACHRLASIVPEVPWRLIVAGDGDPAVVESLKALSASGDAATRIEFRGWVSGAEKQALLAGALLLAAPSHQESFGLSLVEAMASGVPVLTSTEIDLAVDIEDARAGWVVNPAPDALARALEEALRNPEEWRIRRESARRFAGGYSWPASISRLLGLYGQVLDHHPAAVAGVAIS
jgi:D-inositol-3-phosphate glycosyltransferase